MKCIPDVETITSFGVHAVMMMEMGLVMRMIMVMGWRW